MFRWMEYWPVGITDVSRSGRTIREKRFPEVTFAETKSSVI